MIGRKERLLRIAMRMAGEAARKLRVFDFDDTLVSSTSTIVVEHGDGEITHLSNAEFTYFRGVSGDQISFEDFNNVTHPRIIKGGMDAIRKDAADPEARTVILTARPKGSASAVTKFMASLGIKNVEVVGLQSSDPMDKAKWIQNNSEGMEDITFMDDSKRNVDAVETLQGNIKAKLKTSLPKKPEEADYDGEEISQVFESDNPSHETVKFEKDQGGQEEKEEQVSESHRTSPWWKKQTHDFKRKYCEDHPDSPYCACKVASSNSKVKALTEGFDSAPLECDGMTRVLHTFLEYKGVSHTPMIGVVRWKDKVFNPHFWIELRDGSVVDYRLRMWFGPSAPHGVFNPKAEGVTYEGRKANLPLLNDFMFQVLSGRSKEAGLKEIVQKITKRIRDSELAKYLIEKVQNYSRTKNPDDDLTSQEVAAIYRGEDYGDDFDISGGKEIDIGWTNHAEYRCDLRDVDPSRVNDKIREFAERHPGRHQKFNVMDRGGRAVVDIDTTAEPEEAAVVTVIASGRKGDCYQAAGRFMMDNGRGGQFTLVHGEVRGRGDLEGIRYGHAWIETGGNVLEVANGKNAMFPKDLYYALGDIKRTVKYDHKTFQERILKYKHWGPWDLRTKL